MALEEIGLARGEALEKYDLLLINLICHLERHYSCNYSAHQWVISSARSRLGLAARHKAPLIKSHIYCVLTNDLSSHDTSCASVLEKYMPRNHKLPRDK